jgi:pimeloyl-ACP methyl ester carboxylesterase
MLRKRKNLLKIKLILFSILLPYLFFCDNFLQFRMSDDEIKGLFAETAYQVEVDYYDTLGRKMRYVTIGADSLPKIVFIHGSPSSVSAWSSFMKDTALLNNYQMVMVDRPGYGYSGFGTSERSIEKQANLIRPVLKKNDQPLYLVGVSYGGPVASKLAMDHPDVIDGLFLLSASIAPAEEKIYWISYPTSNWFLKWFIPTAFRVANEEKLAHREQLEALLPSWEKIKAPVKVVHGDKDELIYPANADFAKKMITNSAVEVVMISGMGHGMQFSHPDIVKEQLFKFLENVK